MKIAIISDIHGNYDALYSVLDKAKKENVDHLLILGDIVGYYYYPEKVLNLLNDWNFDIIKGNHEQILQDLTNDPSLSESIRLKYGSGHNEAIKKLSLEQLNYLFDLPESKAIKFDKINMLMCHGSPWSNDSYIYPDSNNNIINKCDKKDFDFVFIGHSHYPFAIKNRYSILINPGSVGQSRQIGGNASWCILNTVNCCFQFFSTDYNTKNLQKIISEKDPDIKYLSDILKRK